MVQILLPGLKSSNIMPQSFRPLNMEEECTLLARGEETTTPQVARDTLNTKLDLLPILDPHATWVPSNTLERHSIGSCVADDVRNLITSSSLVKLVGS